MGSVSRRYGSSSARQTEELSTRMARGLASMISPSGNPTMKPNSSRLKRTACRFGCAACRTASLMPSLLDKSMREQCLHYPSNLFHRRCLRYGTRAGSSHGLLDDLIDGAGAVQIAPRFITKFVQFEETPLGEVVEQDARRCDGPQHVVATLQETRGE